MLVQVGRRVASEDVVDLLIECHGRIRRFLAMARDLADPPRTAVAADIAATAGQIRRYFAESFALHVEDEESDLAPHLSEGVAARLVGEHDTQDGPVADLVALCADLERHPEHLATQHALLRSTVRDLIARLDVHLAFEEDVVFPEIRALGQAQRDAIRAAMRARRERSLR